MTAHKHLTVLSSPKPKGVNSQINKFKKKSPNKLLIQYDGGFSYRLLSMLSLASESLHSVYVLTQGVFTTLWPWHGPKLAQSYVTHTCTDQRAMLICFWKLSSLDKPFSFLSHPCLQAMACKWYIDRQMLYSMYKPPELFIWKTFSE